MSRLLFYVPCLLLFGLFGGLGGCLLRRGLSRCSILCRLLGLGRSRLFRRGLGFGLGRSLGLCLCRGCGLGGGLLGLGRGFRLRFGLGRGCLLLGLVPADRHDLQDRVLLAV